MSGSPTGDLHPICNAPMLGAHQLMEVNRQKSARFVRTPEGAPNRTVCRHLRGGYLITHVRSKPFMTRLLLLMILVGVIGTVTIDAEPTNRWWTVVRGIDSRTGETIPTMASVIFSGVELGEPRVLRDASGKWSGGGDPIWHSKPDWSIHVGFTNASLPVRLRSPGFFIVTRTITNGETSAVIPMTWCGLGHEWETGKKTTEPSQSSGR